MSQSSSTYTAGPIPLDSAAAAQLEGTVLRDDITQLNVGAVSATSAISQQPHPPPLDPSSLDPILTRDHLIYETTVNGTEIFNANQLGLFDPFDKFLDLPSIAEVTKSYTYWRGGLRVRVVVTPPGSCYGAMVLSAICEGGPSVPPTLAVNARTIDDANADVCFNSFNDVFRVINFEQASAVEISLPFVYWQNYAPLRGPALWMWRLQLQSLVNIQSTISTSAAATIKIYAALEPGYELCVPYYQMKPNHNGLDGFTKKASTKKAFNASSVATTKFSDVAASVAGIAGKVGGLIPALAPFTTPLAAGASIVSSVASFFGFTRESTYQPPDPFVARYFSQPCYVDGVDSGDKLVTLQGSALAIDGPAGGGEAEDIMSFESIRQRWGMIGSFDLTTTSPSGTILYQLPVTPSYCAIMLGLTWFTPGGYYGLPFSKWRGGMEYLIYIPSSPNMRGMLQIFYNPTPTASAPTLLPSADKTGLAHSVSLDLSGTQQRMIHVPYAGPETCKENLTMADGQYTNRVPEACNGSLDFYLSMPWVAPRTGTLTTKVIILARPAADMQFADVRQQVNNHADPFVDLMRYQSAAVDDSVSVIEETILNQGMGPSYNLAQLSTTEVAPSARALVQKFSTLFNLVDVPWYRLAFNYAHTVSTWTVPMQATYSRDSVVINETHQPWSWLGHYAVLYTGYRGGVRYKLVNKGPLADTVTHPSAISATSVRHVYREMDGLLDDTKSAHYVVQPFDADHAVEFSFPFVSDRLYYNPREIPPPTIPGGANDLKWYRDIVFMRKDGSQGSWNNVLFAGADDFSVTRFRRVPGTQGPL
jgi:hypothetical protein